MRLQVENDGYGPTSAIQVSSAISRHLLWVALELFTDQAAVLCVHEHETML